MGKTGTVGRQRHVGEAAAALQPLAPLGIELRVFDDAQNFEIVVVEDHQVIGGAELLVETTRLNLEPQPLVGGLRRINAVDHDHHMIKALHCPFHAGRRRIMLMPLAVMTSSPFWFTACHASWMMPSSGLLLDGTFAAHSTQAESVSPGRTGFSQRISSMPGEPSAVRLSR